MAKKASKDNSDLKTASVTIRIKPEIKELWYELARDDYRSPSSWLEKMVADKAEELKKKD